MRTLTMILLLPVFGYTVQAQDSAGAEVAPDTANTLKTKKIIDELTYETHAGLPLAASKIYFSDNKFTISGFGEMSYTHYNGPKNNESGDIELYMTNLYRFVGYLAYKPTDKVVLYGEVFGEAFQDGFDKLEHEFFIEAFADFLLSKHFNVRVGTHQVQTGYINNHDEPVMYYSVNRPEVERLIIPSQWIDLGVMTYGTISENLHYTFSVYQGLDSRNYYGGTWIRGGRDNNLRFNFDAPLLNSQLNFSGIKNTDISFSGVWTRGGSNRAEIIDGEEVRVKANTMLFTSHVRHEYKNWTFMALGSYGRMEDTDQIYALNSPLGLSEPPTGTVDFEPGRAVLGREVYGAYVEVGHDILPYLRKDKEKTVVKNKENGSDSFFFKKNEMKLPVFLRYERLNTHSSIHESFDKLRAENGLFQNDLHVLTMGFNFNLRKNFVLKANYQFRENKTPIPTGQNAGMYEGDRVELGLGFIF